MTRRLPDTPTRRCMGNLDSAMPCTAPIKFRVTLSNGSAAWLCAEHRKNVPLHPRHVARIASIHSDREDRHQ